MRKEAVSELARGREGGWREGAYPVSPPVTLERERGRVQSMHFMLITMPFHGEQIGSFAGIFQIILPSLFGSAR